MPRVARSVPSKRIRKAIWGSPFRATAVVLGAFLLVAMSFSPAQAGKGGKVATDLEAQIQSQSPANQVRLVLNLRGADPDVVSNKVKELGGAVRGVFKNVGEMALDLPLGSVMSLSQVDGVDYIAPDRAVAGNASHLETTTGASLVYPTLQAPGVDGTGVTVAILDSGVDGDHFDLRDEVKGKRRVVFSLDFTGKGSLDDPYGHGTHIAGLIAGDGTSYTVGRGYAGIAPGANLINFKVLDEYGRGYVSNVVAAIDQAISIRSVYNIRVINLSLAAPPIDSYLNDPMCQAVDRATRAGISVVVAAGNFGQDSNGNQVYGGISSPGISPSAITVGATITYGTDVRSDDVIAPYSSRGPTLSHWTDPATGQAVYDNLAKPDLVAPGTRVVALERYSNYLVTNYPVLHVDTGSTVNNKSRYMLLTGTSMATGVVSGAVALMYQANPGLTPNLVKSILMFSAQIMNGPDLFSQGAGMLNVEGAVRLSKSASIYAYSLPVGSTLIQGGLPNVKSKSNIAGESCLWSQSLIWGRGMLQGDAILTTQQAAYASTLIWGIGRLDAWGMGVTYYDGLYSASDVLFGNNNQWSYATWSSGTAQSSGLIWADRLSASGLIWGDRLICSDFFDASSSSLIWGYKGYDSSLIWGLRDAGLIWGINNAW